ncbi:hypothetical protein [Treponema endosymbiont of Eucomonympha sp.]|uniref:hypothetical protein n=1 Tax=Treponema endosymbiont of Eucomonympha sp. TaxID=1580831 RepID=UPI0007514071|nr:hypothetical protein [Treponema endosymbiont of Eucomonympha sp.]
MENRMTVRVFCLLAAFLGGCGGNADGIFSAINAETKLSSNRTAPGNILSIVQYRGALYAAGGKIYRKADYTKEGKWLDSSKPDGLVVRLAAGYSEGEEYLYALTAKTDSSGTETHKLWYSADANSWKEVSGITGTPKTIFSNHAVSVTNLAQENCAYMTTSEGTYELQGLKASFETTNDGLGQDENGKKKLALAAAYANGEMYFADTAAFASDGTYLFRGDGTKISYGTATPLNLSVEVEGISTIMSLWAHKTKETDGTFTGTLYIGTASGIKTVPYSTDTGAPEPNPDTGKPKATSPGNATSTALGNGNYEVPAVFVTAGEEAVYASTVGITATQGTKKNGLWGYYPGVRETWDWE